MYKKIILIILLSLCLMSCSEKDLLESDLNKLKEEKTILLNDIQDLKNEKELLNKQVVDIKIEQNTAKYIITIQIGQDHPWYDLENNIKDSMNQIELTLPVSKDFYNSVDIGTILNNDFRTGSFIMSGSIGNWDIKVINKEIQ